VTSSSAVPMTITLVGTLLGVGLLVWGRDVLGLDRVVLWYGVGLALAFSPATTLFASNPWKFGFALPVTVIALALASRLGRPWELGALAVLTVVAALNDFRSAFGLLLLATLLVFGQMVVSRRGRRLSPAAVLVGLGALGLSVFQLGQALILDGYLGAETQARSVEQLRSSGSLVLGGRPELAATFALMRHHPWGFGVGSVPTAEDVQVAKEGMASIGYQPDNGYVERFMFGGHFELHSVFGPVGAVGHRRAGVRRSAARHPGRRGRAPARPRDSERHPPLRGVPERLEPVLRSFLQLRAVPRDRARTGPRAGPGERSVSS
jgi:hypothetical protein